MSQSGNAFLSPRGPRQADSTGFYKLAGAIGDAQVRNRGTIGGSIANNDPAADYPAGLLALGAIVQTDRASDIPCCRDART